MSGLSRHLRSLHNTMPALKVKIANQVIAVESAQQHQENFRNRKWTDTGTRWAPRKDNDTSRALLVKTGRLRRTATHARIKRDAVDYVMPTYGKYHNEGEGNQPKRQFAGESRILKNRFRRKAQIVINRHLKGL